MNSKYSLAFKQQAVEKVLMRSEEEYLLSVAQYYFPKKTFQVTGRMAGLRVLPKVSNSAFKRSREIILLTDNESKPRLLSIYGGKLTVYRATAEKVMTVLKRTLSEKKVMADSKKLRLTGVS